MICTGIAQGFVLGSRRGSLLCWLQKAGCSRPLAGSHVQNGESGLSCAATQGLVGGESYGSRSLLII